MPRYSKGPYGHIEDEYILRPSEGVRHVNTQEWTSRNLHTCDTWINGYFDINNWHIKLESFYYERMPTATNHTHCQYKKMNAK